MKKFFLSENRNFPFKLLGVQHISMLIITLFLFILVFKFKEKLIKLNNKNFKLLRIIIGLMLLLNMFVYRFSYMYYGIYDIKIHLSLYYCHIVNYMFVAALIINYMPFYKFVYGLSWIGSIWTVLFPNFNVGIDCFILYNSFISHNLLILFTTLIMTIKKINYSIKDCFKCMIGAITIFLFTYMINYDFGTNFNSPHSILGIYSNYSIIKGYDILFIMGLIGGVLGLIINKFILKKYKRRKIMHKNIIIFFIVSAFQFYLI